MTTQTATDTRELILDATDRLLARYGFRKTTMEDIAQEAGVSRRTIYLHFRSKEEVGLSSIDRVVYRAQDRLREIASSPASAPERLFDMLVTRVMARIDQIQEYRSSLDELFEAVRPAYLARRTMHFEVEMRLLADVLRQGERAEVFAVDDAELTAATLVRAMNAFLPYSLSVAELGARDQIEAGARRLASLLLRGLANGGHAPWEHSPRD
jgi:AcrR family transcriptional regulator